MGNYLSTLFPNNQQNNNDENNKKLEELYQRLEKLEKIDINHDGIISKDEFEKWKNNDLITIKNTIKNEVKEEYVNKITELDNTIKDLHKEIVSLKDENKELDELLKDKNHLIEKLGANIKTDEDVKQLIQMLSQEQINHYVEELLENEETNIRWLPDVVERKIYRNMFKLMIKLMNKVLNSMSFELVGHKLNINMIPTST